jgi:hypothetical protein
MALSESVLENKLIALFNLMKTVPMTDENYAKQLAKIINEQIKTAVVNPGINVQVDPVTGAGATTGSGALI